MDSKETISKRRTSQRNEIYEWGYRYSVEHPTRYVDNLPLVDGVSANLEVLTAFHF